MFLKNIMPNSKKKIGLKSRIALVEAAITMLSCVYSFIPYGFKFNVNTLCLVPVFCIMASCNISSFTSIQLGATSFYGSCIASLYSYIIILITRDTVWITFITTFLFSYMIATMVSLPTRKWVGGLFMKKMFLDIIVILYFAPIETVRTNIWQNIVGACFVFSSIIIGHVCFPTLASRLLFNKTLKTLKTTRIYFRAIGHQLQEKLDLNSGISNNNNNNSNNNNNVGGGNNILNNLKNTTDAFSQQTFDDVENQLIKEQQFKKSQSDQLPPLIINSPTLASSLLIPLQNTNSFNDDNYNENNNKDDEIEFIEPKPTEDKEGLKLKLPLARSILIEKNLAIEIPSTTTTNNNVPLSPITLNDNTSSLLVNESMLSNSIIHSGGGDTDITETNNDNKNKRNSKENIIEMDKSKTKKHKRNKQNDEDSKTQFNEKELNTLESKLTGEILRMTALFNEAKLERWNNDLISNYNKLVLLFELSSKQLISIKKAIKNGFTPLASQELINPLIPFIECLVEEVYLQMGLMIDILSSNTPNFIINNNNLNNINNNINNNSSNNIIDIVGSILEESFDESEELVTRVRGAFRKSVEEFESYGHQVLSFPEVTSVCYFFHNIMTFTLQQRQLANLLIKVKKQQHKESCRLELVRNGLLFILTGLPIFIINRFKNLIKWFNNNNNDQDNNSNINNDKKENNENNNIFKRCMKWIEFNCIRDLKWRYPLKVAFGLMSSIIAFYYFEGRRHGDLVIHGIWTCATVMLVMVPSVGATITRGTNRIVGTIFGAFVGFLTSLLCSIIPTPGKEIVMLIIIFIFVYFISFPQQDVRYSYAGAVSGITFLIIVLGQNFSKNFDYMYAIMRAFHIVMGVVWVIFISLFIFPYFTYKATRIKIFQVTNNMSDTFIKIIENGLRLNEPIKDLTNNLSIFNQDQGNNFDNYRDDKVDEKNKLVIKLISNDQIGINDIIKIEATNKDLISTERQKKREQTIESIRSIRVGIDQIKASLYDVRSEMLFVSPSKTNRYFSIVEKMDDCLTQLVALENSFFPIFSDTFKLTTFQLVLPLSLLFQQLNHSKLLLKQLISSGGDIKPSSSSQQTIMETSLLIKNSQTQIDECFQNTRILLLNEKVFHFLYPEMIQFGSGMLSIRDFVQSYTLLFEELRLIRKEKSYLKYFLRIKQK
ncbi:hypothetical protein RB653_001520 [Dictyostelium firmibasis]|uniref:Uncharacterized protein n=1 Tax=Dictyostelium firmibasis TaxID=79012 RepID=A0AAN7U467_9MYCE